LPARGNGGRAANSSAAPLGLSGYAAPLAETAKSAAFAVRAAAQAQRIDDSAVSLIILAAS
jgi:hypothetical protein